MNLRDKALISGFTALLMAFGTPSVASIKTYDSCNSLNKVFAGGVSGSKFSKNIGESLAKSPRVSSSTYKANKKLDFDKDGIVCEVVKKNVAELTISLDNLDPKWVRIYGVREVTKAMQKASDKTVNLSLSYIVSPSVVPQAEALVRLQIDNAARLFSSVFSGESIAVNIYTEKESPSGYSPRALHTCGGFLANRQINLCMPTTGTYGIDNPGIPYHEFVHVAQVVEGFTSNNFFMEGGATYIAAVLGHSYDGAVDSGLEEWLNRPDGWKTAYESLGYKYTADDMTKFLGLVDSPVNTGRGSVYASSSYKLGSAMWEVMIAVYGWDKYMSFMNSVSNGKTYEQNFELEYGISQSVVHAKIAKYILSINWGR